MFLEEECAFYEEDIFDIYDDNNNKYLWGYNKKEIKERTFPLLKKGRILIDGKE